MANSLYCTLSLFLTVSWSQAWTPGVATPAPLTDLSVTHSDRNDVLSFYQHVFKASENYSSVINWTGNHGTCSEGLMNQPFIDLMRRRVNYYRAMAGVSANITMNTASTVVTPSDPYAAAGTTTKSLAALRSALLLSRSNILTHNPSTSYSCFSTAGGNGSYFGNIALGIYGPPALDAYMREDENNTSAGHRRWMLFTRAVNFATGDIPRVGNYLSSNSLYIRQRSDELIDGEVKFIPWPPAGFFPWQHSTEYWSLSYPGADFSTATIAVSKAGVPQTVLSINRAQGLGNNGIAWRMAGIAKSGFDTTYDVTVSNIGGNGVPSSYSYSFTFFNAENLLVPPTLTGPTTAPPGGSKSYAIGPVSIAEEYRLEVGKKSTLPTTTIEGGEDATAAFIIPGPVTGYNLRPSTAGYYRTGTKSLNLAFTDASQGEQWVQLERVLLPKSASTIKYYCRIGFLSSNTTFVAQYCLNNDNQWQDILGTAKAGTSPLNSSSSVTESAFSAQLSFNLPAETIDKPTKIRFLIRKEAGAEFLAPTNGGTNYTGAFIDDISFTNVDWLSTRVLTNFPANTSTVTLNANTAGEPLAAGAQYVLRLQPRVATSWLTSSNMLSVVVSSNSAPTLDPVSGPIVILEDASLQTIPLTGILSGSLDENQILTVSATSSNTALIPNPSVIYSSPSDTGSLQFQPALNQSGSATISVTVNDGQATNNTVVRTFTVNVTAVNDAPTISLIANRSINEDTNTGAIAFTISDVETAVGSLTISRNSSDLNLIPINNIVLAGTTAARTVTITPPANQYGLATISITVSDGAASTTRTFDLTVNPVNDAPTLNTIVNPTAILEDAAIQTIALSGIGAGLNESQALTITATSSNANIIPHPTVLYSSPNASGSLQYTPLANASGTVTITVTVNDGQSINQTVSRTFTVAVTAVNDAPSISVISDRSTNEDTSTGAIAFSISDLETAVTSLTITRASLNTTLVPLTSAVIGGSGANRTITITPAANQVGTATIEITVSDGKASSKKSFVLTVVPVNDAPTFSSIANPVAINEDASQQTVSLSGISSGFSNEVQPLTITASSNNTALIPHPSVIYTSPSTSGSLRYTPVQNASGTAIITVTINDGSPINGTFSRTFTVTVKAVNDAPTISVIPTRIMVQNTTSPAIPFTVGDLETAATSLTLSAVSGSTTILPTANITFGGSGANRTVTLKPATGKTGTTTVTINVRDGALTTASKFTLIVNLQNSAPTITNISNQTIDANTATDAIPFFVGDPEGLLDNLTLSATSSNLSLLPTSSIVFSGSASNRSVQLTPLANQSGITTVTITVSDNQSLNSFASISFTLQVNPIVGNQPIVIYDPWLLAANYELIETSFDEDFDKDGIANGIEYAFSLDPTQPSKLAELQLDLEGKTMSISMPLPIVRENITYSAEYSDDLKTWLKEDLEVVIANGEIIATCPMGAKARFIHWKIIKN